MIALNSSKMGFAAPSGSPIAFKCVVSSLFPGTAEYVQLFNGYTTNTENHCDTSGTDWLDTADPYPYSTPLPTTPSSVPNDPLNYAQPVFVDAPWDTCLNSPSISMSTFTDYLKFMPNGSGNIFVTLGKITWKEYGKANLVNGAWNLDPSSYVVPPSGPVDSDAFPAWTHTYTLWNTYGL
jgi:hypothetical protein